jgi:Holliday junction resolvase RusA-like endonuclease
MMQELSKFIFLDLPLPPSVNSYWGFSGHRRFLTAKAVKFKQEVAHAVSQQDIKFGSARLEMTITIHFADRRVQDLSNRIKALEDALVQSGLMDDDSQIKILHVYEKAIVKGGKCLVKINVLPS